MRSMNYKEHSLGRLKEWLHDCLGAAEASPQEIFDAIKEVVQEEYYYYKNGASKTYELLSLLNGKVVFNIDPAGNKVESNLDDELYKTLSCDKDNSSPECQKAWNDFWEEHYYPEEVKKDKVTKWQLPVELDAVSGEYYVCFPDDLLEVADLKEGDQVKWIDNYNGSYTLKKVKDPLHPSWTEGSELAKTKNYYEMIEDGWTMTGDGFWIKEN